MNPQNKLDEQTRQQNRRDSARKWRQNNPDYQKLWIAANRDKHNSYSRASVKKWRLLHPEANTKRRNVGHIADHTTTLRNGHLLREYGLSLIAYDLMNADQGGVCKICGCAESAQFRGRVLPLAVDHCHITGQVRGLLCKACNAILGLVKDNSKTLIDAAVYLVHSTATEAPSHHG